MPKLSPERQRVFTGIRLTRTVREALEQAAERKGTTFTAEVEMRLIQSLAYEQTEALAELIGRCEELAKQLGKASQ